MDTPLISFIIPFYGEASRDLLRACLQSVRSQPAMRGEDYEIILATDGSHGLGGARNCGLRQAKGVYVAFVDADDFLFPASLYIPDFLRGEAAPDIYTFGFKKVKAGCTLAPLPNRAQVGCAVYDSGAQYMLEHNINGSVCHHFFHRGFLLAHHLSFAEDCYHEDEDFTARAYALAGKIAVTSRVMYAYRQTPGSISRSRLPGRCLRRADDFHTAILRLRSFRFQSDGLEPVQCQALERRLCFLTIDYFRQILRDRLCPAEICRRAHRLRQEGFLPLPPAPYGSKYAMARVVLNLLTWRL